MHQRSTCNNTVKLLINPRPAQCTSEPQHLIGPGIYWRPTIC